MNYYYNLKLFFNDLVEKYYDKAVIKYKKKEYSYSSLNKKSEFYEKYFVENNIVKGSVIGIVNTKIIEDYALMIACIKSGIAYVNLDIDNPQKRLEDIINICKPAMIFSDINKENIDRACKNKNVPFNIYENIKVDSSTVIPEVEIDGNTLAYIMFTSGSTGTPKGVAITHQNIIHLINWTKQRYEITESDILSNINPMYFDNSVFDFYSSVFNGASLVPVNKDFLSKPMELVEYIDVMKCSIWFSVPSMLIYLTIMKVLNKNTLKKIRIFTFGGEGYPKTELKKLFDLYSDNSRFINVYGPTEGTCICSSYEITEKDFEDLSELPSLGTINQNFSYVILDNDGKESNIGELCILGPNVGVGYYNEIEKTNTSFICYSNKNHYLNRMYKTGDLVEEKEGLLYFKGRVDNQIKHMGYRIELEEIEFALNELNYVEQSAVLYKREKTAYGKIVAFLSSVSADISEVEVRKDLKDKLPAYMIPNVIKSMKILPKNQNGKIDKKELETLL